MKGPSLLSLLLYEDMDSFPSEEAGGVDDTVLESEAEFILDNRPIGLDGGLLASITGK